MSLKDPKTKRAAPAWTREALLIVTLVVFVAFSVARAQADAGCPKIHSLIDFNCDGEIKIAFLGDSITKGVHDSFVPPEGYPGRIQDAWKFAKVENLGVSGITSSRLLQNVKQLLQRRPKHNTSVSLHSADIVFITVGVNDFYQEDSPGLVIKNIVELIKFLKSKLKHDDGTAPQFIVGTLLRSKRLYQQPFIKQVDDLLLRYSSSSVLPVYLRFDTIDVDNQNILYLDGLHPDGSGYDVMAQLVTATIKTTVQTLMARQRSDRDHDGIYDQLETKFGTSPNNPDTDGDTLSDGDEIFTYGTDPTKKDTDGNGIDDEFQILTPTPTPLPSVVPTP